MHIPLSTVTTVCVLLDMVDLVFGHDNEALEIMFRQRTRSDWEKVWHQESHSRCRDKLISHLYWACEKDIYRLARRNSVLQKDQDTTAKRSSLPWLTKETAKSMLRSRRSRRRVGDGSITAECCTRVGCTWEEYAEYCPTNKRIIKYV